MNGTIAWLLLFAAILGASIIGTAALLHLLRRTIDPPADELHIFPTPLPARGRRHRLHPDCWCRPDTQHDGDTTWISHHNGGTP